MGERGRLRQAIAETKQRDAELRLRMEDLRNRFVEEATSEAGKLENDIIQTRERIRPLRDAKKRLQVKAPVSGKVVDLKVHSRGGVVRPGEPLMDIVPHDTPLIVETQVPINKITEVYIGQDALVQLDAFDTRIIPHIPAKVTYISADRLEDKTSAGTMPYYLCYVVIDPQALKEAQLYLSPGMPATVFITTKKAYRALLHVRAPAQKLGSCTAGSEAAMCFSSMAPAPDTATPLPGRYTGAPLPAGSGTGFFYIACLAPAADGAGRGGSFPACRPDRSTVRSARTTTFPIQPVCGCWIAISSNCRRPS